MRSVPKPLCPMYHFHVSDLKHGNISFDPSIRRKQQLQVTESKEQYKIPNKIPKKIYTHKEAPRPKERGAIA